jgi:hypothetical protein
MLIDAPRTIDEHVGSLTTRVERVEKRTYKPGVVLYVQPDEPLGTDDDDVEVGVPIGTLWFDTDDPVP